MALNRVDVVFSGGGTGGHVYPALAIAEILRIRGISCAYIGTPNGIEASLVARTQIPYFGIDAAPVKGRNAGKAVLAMGTAARATAEARSLIKSLRARMVICTGGYVAGPVGLAASTLGLKMLLVEPNAVMGLTNKLLTRLCDGVVTAFEDAPEGIPKKKRLYMGVPIRPGFVSSVPEPFTETPRLLVLGGSQGAHFLNEVVPEALGHLLTEGVHVSVLHQTGTHDVELVTEAYQRAGVTARVESYLEAVPAALKEAHLVIARSGAGTVAEVCAVGRPAVFVPLPSAADDHQTANAERVVRAGAALLAPQGATSPVYLSSLLSGLLASPERLEKMAEASRHLGNGDAARHVADHVETSLYAQR